MPGIVGLVSRRPRGWAHEQLLRMLQVTKHEAFYTTGTWMDEASGVYVGWTAHENNFADAMPVRNERGDKVLIFSGEEYSSPDEVRNLAARGHDFPADGPSYLVHLYEDDRSFPASLNGRFHGLVADVSGGTAVLFNDRFGMQRLYYHESPDAFYFAAEAKAILAVRPELRRIDMRSLGEFVSCGCVLQGRTLFSDIHQLPPASAWTFRAGAVESRRQYFEARDWEEQAQLDPEPYHEALREVFSRNLPRYFNGGQGIGMSLTGGLDTRMVMAWQKLRPGSLPCYTYGDSYRECRDVVVARQVAQACQQPHQVLLIGQDFLSRFPHYAERSMYLTDACVDVTRAPDLFLSEKARQIAPVRMTGLYGDEILRPQIRAFKPLRQTPQVFNPSFMSCVTAASETYAGEIRTHPLSFAAFRQAPWHHYGALALEQTQLTVRTPFLDNDLVRTVFKAPASVARNNDLRVRLIGDGDRGLQRIRTDRGFAGSGGPISSWLSQNFHQFTFRAEYAFDYGMPQSLARIDHLFANLRLERLFLGRHKLYHYRVWYRDVLADYVRAMLLDSRTLGRPYLDRRAVEAVVDGHMKGTRNYTTEIHRVLSLELMHRLFIDS
jgi:asparagine synthase (glutamine-hydrolysing)